MFNPRNCYQIAPSSDDWLTLVVVFGGGKEQAEGLAEGLNDATGESARRQSLVATSRMRTLCRGLGPATPSTAGAEAHRTAAPDHCALRSPLVYVLCIYDDDGVMRDTPFLL